MKPLSIDRLRRLQTTLEGRVANRDPANIQAVGFAPMAGLPPGDADGGESVVAQFDVSRKLQDVADERRIQAIEPVRLLDRDAGRYEIWRLPTQVRESGKVLPTGVQVRLGERHATAAIVVRWSRYEPTPVREPQPDPDDHRWRWGILTVAHLFAGEAAGRAAEIERLIACGGTSAAIAGRLTAAGRIPGGPDIALVETGYDRLQLSGFIKAADTPADDPADEAGLLRLITRGGSGVVIGDGSRRSCRWRAFYPSLSIATLGKLAAVVAVDGEEQQFASGTSGSLLVVAGVPVGLQIGAATPGYDVGYFQCFLTALPYLAEKLGASSLEIIAVV